jgi:hypothetical protein
LTLTDLFFKMDAPHMKSRRQEGQSIDYTQQYFTAISPPSSGDIALGARNLLRSSSRHAQVPANPQSVNEAVKNLKSVFPEASDIASNWDYPNKIQLGQSGELDAEKLAKVGVQSSPCPEVDVQPTSGIGAALAASGNKHQSRRSRDGARAIIGSTARSNDFIVHAIQAAKGLHILTRTVVVEYAISPPRDLYDSKASLLKHQSHPDQAKHSQNVNASSDPKEVFACIKATTLYIHLFFEERKALWQIRHSNGGQSSMSGTSIPSPPRAMAPGSLRSAGSSLGVMAPGSLRSSGSPLGAITPGSMRSSCFSSGKDQDSCFGSQPSIWPRSSAQDEAETQKRQHLSHGVTVWETCLAEQEAWWEVWTQAMTAVATLAEYIINPTLKQQHIPEGGSNMDIKSSVDNNLSQTTGASGAKITPSLLSDVFQFIAMSSEILPEVRKGEFCISLDQEGEVTCKMLHNAESEFVLEKVPFAMYSDLSFATLCVAKLLQNALHAVPPSGMQEERNNVEVVWKQTWDIIREQLIQNERTWLMQRQEIHKIQAVIVSSLCLLEQDENTSVDELCQSYLDMSGAEKDGALQMHVYSKALTTVIKSWLQTALAGWPEELSCRRRDKVSGFEMGLALRNGSIDWESNSSMMVTDIASNGWLPFHFAHVEMDSNDGDGSIESNRAALKDDIDEVVFCLIELTERGLFKGREASYLFDQKSVAAEDVTAASCAAESICALAALGDALVTISRPRFWHLVHRLCYILAAAEALESGDDSSRYLDISYHSYGGKMTSVADNGQIEPSGSSWTEKTLKNEIGASFTSSDGIENAQLETMELIRAQRNACLLDNAELLWFFLSNEVTCEGTITCLISMLSERGELAEVNDDAAFQVVGAIRTLGTALFGHPPEVSGIALLRPFWMCVLEAFSKLAPKLGAHAESHKDSKSNTARDRRKVSMLLEIIVATRRLLENIISAATVEIENEDTPPYILLPQEYEFFNKLIDTTFVPALNLLLEEFTESNLNEGENLSDEERLLSTKKRILANECLSVLENLEVFLRTTNALMMEEQTRNMLYGIILDKICPLLYIFRNRRLDEAEGLTLSGESVARSVFSSWALFGCTSTYRREKWSDIAARFLLKAFAVYDKADFGFDHSGHVHPARVRKEAMEILVFGADSTHLKWDVVSPFELSRCDEQLHSELLWKAFLPRIMSVLSIPEASSNEDFLIIANSYASEGEEDNAQYCVYERNFMAKEVDCLRQAYIDSSKLNCARYVMDQSADITGPIAVRRRALKDEIQLKRQTIKVLGHMFQSLGTDRRFLSSVVKALSLVAVGDCLGSLKFLDGIDQADSRVRIESLFPHSIASLQEASLELRLEAIYQIEKCLRSAFSNMYQIHWIIPLIMKSLSCVALFYGQRFKEECSATRHNGGIEELFEDTRFVLLRLTLAAVLPLARLRVTHDGRAVLITKSSVLAMIPSSAMLFAFDGNDEKIEAPLDPHISRLSLQEKRVSGIDDDESLSSDTNSVDDSFTTCSTTTEEDDRALIAPFLYVSRRLSYSQRSKKGAIRRHAKEGDGLEWLQDSNIDRESTSHERTTISFDRLLTLLARCLQIFAPSASKEGNRDIKENDARETLASADSGIEERSNSKVDRDKYLASVLRTLCVATVEAILICGVALLCPDDTGIIQAVSAIQEQDFQFPHEHIAAARAMAEFSCYAGHDRCAQVELDQVCPLAVPGTRNLLNALVTACCSEVQEVVSIGCRGLSRLLSVVYSTSNFKDGNNVLTVQGVCGALVVRVDDLVNTFDNDVDVDPSIVSHFLGPLLLCLYDVFSLVRERDYENDMHMIDVSYACRFVLICYQICSTEKHARPLSLIAMHCVAKACRMISPLEARKLAMSCKILEADQGCDVSHSESIWDESDLRLNEFQRIILDFLVRGYPSLSPHPRGTHLRIAQDCHDVLIREFEDLKTFEFSPSAASSWLASDGVLTCRIGLGNCRGWVEVAFRSSVTSIRRLVRLTEFPSIDFPCASRTSDVSEANAKSDGAKEAEQGRREPNLYLMDRYSVANSDVIQNSLSILQDFDSFFASNDLLKGFDEKISITHGIECLDATKLLDHFETKAESGGRRVDDFIQPRGGGHRLSEADPCLKQWLLPHLRWNTPAVAEVLNQLSEFGFLPTMLGEKDETEVESVSGRSLKYLAHEGRVARAIKTLDRTHPMQTHKVALLFLGQGSGCDMDSGDEHTLNENVVLGARHGSPDFVAFREGLGTLVPTSELRFFSGGLDTTVGAADGDLALFWTSETPLSSIRVRGAAIGGTMVCYHDVTLMPPGLNKRKRHVGNDSVHIVFVEKGSSIGACLRAGKHDRGSRITDDALTISGQFGFVTIFVVPLKGVDAVKVIVRVRDDSDVFLSNLAGTCVLPTSAAPLYVRHLAIRADLACQALTEDQVGLASNWEERLLQLRTMSRLWNK